MKICAVTGTDMKKDDAVALTGEHVLQPELAETEQDRKEIEAHMAAVEKGAEA